MSKRYLYDSNDVLQGVFENENALHRYLNSEYQSESDTKGLSGKMLTNKIILPSVFKIERRLLHKQPEEVDALKRFKSSGSSRRCIVTSPCGGQTTFESILAASQSLNVNNKTLGNHLDKGIIKGGQLKGYAIRRLEAA